MKKLLLFLFLFIPLSAYSQVVSFLDDTILFAGDIVADSTLSEVSITEDYIFCRNLISADVDSTTSVFGPNGDISSKSFNFMPEGNSVIQFTLTKATGFSGNIYITAPSGDIYTIDWGDGSVIQYTTTGGTTYAEHTTFSHVYSAGGYLIKAYGPFHRALTLELQVIQGALNISQFNPCVAMTDLRLGAAEDSLSGSYSSLSRLTKLERLDIEGDLEGDGSFTNTLSNLARLNLRDNNLTTADVATFGPLPKITQLNLNTSTWAGNVSSISAYTTLEVLYLNASAVTGDLNFISTLVNAKTIYVYGSNISSYTNCTLPDFVEDTYLSVYNLGLSTAEVDTFLINLNDASSHIDGRTIRINGTNAARSSASDTAIDSLTAKDWNILVNE